MEKSRKGKESNEATAAVDKDLARTEDADGDSDEDCEIYFLKPVNEYNIADKIKEANKELFENSSDTTDADTSPGLRKVTFAINLESYEPKNETDEKKCNSESEPDTNRTLETPKMNVVEQKNLEQILEEDVEPEQSPTDDVEDIAENVTNSLTNKEATDDDIMEEICEEIIILDMETQIKEPIELDAEDTTEPSQHVLSKQDTFDCEEEENGNKEDDNNSTKTKEPLEVVEDDDDLSIIVASYLPDDYDKTSLITDSEQSEQTANSNSQSSNSKRKTSFSFRRKGSNRQNNSSGGFNPFARIRKLKQPHGDGKDIRMNYRTCCEYRDSTIEQLPKYTGYLSEYGLSREQLEDREEKLQRKQFYVLDKTLKTNERELNKMQDNERAFVKWLKNKMRFPINKTRNMFDVRTKFGECGNEFKARRFFTRTAVPCKVGERISHHRDAADI